MPKNVFQGQSDYVDQPNRNTFDLSFSSALSMKFGALYPVMCKEVLPGDSFKIDTQFGLQFVPTYFPLQNRINANLHFFYVRNRNLWKDWQDFIGKTKTGLQPPVVNAKGKEKSAFESMFGVGSLGDFLGVPNTSLRTPDVDTSLKSMGYHSYPLSDDATSFIVLNGTERISSPSNSFNNDVFSIILDSDSVSLLSNSAPALGLVSVFGDSFFNAKWFDDKTVEVPFSTFKRLEYKKLNFENRILFATFYEYPEGFDGTPVIRDSFSCFVDLNSEALIKPVGSLYELLFKNVRLLGETLSDPRKDSTTIYSTYRDGSNPLDFSALSKNVRVRLTLLNKIPLSSSAAYVLRSDNDLVGLSVAPEDGSDNVEVRPVDASASFLKENNISALPFRAYESIYNAFYRDQFNDPFILNGVPEYNKFLPSIEGGTDEEIYTLHYRNWEKDVFTTCKQTPQQGNAPLVGVTVVGDFQFKDSDGNIHTVKPKYGADGKTIESVNFEEKTPSEVRNSMIDLITSGFTINDFRNVNALQRWLETNIRRGFRYKDQIMSHFGVDTRFDTLDMPEFIGGMSRTVSVNMVTNLAASDKAPLGDYAGQLYCNGDAGHSVSKYCDEHGFIIGILSVTPVPVYGQVLPKYFLKRDPMDYYFPEFAHIGMTPLPYSELDPQGQFEKDPKKMDETFGYQRAWYEYLSSIDESHGEFKTTLRNFLMQRYFANPPVLGHDFLQVKPDEINDVFINTENNDKIIGQLRFNIMAKRPIPRFGIPKLEA